jgi:CO dehydrogenase nickel-insertion accessory protein CooC1
VDDPTPLDGAEIPLDALPPDYLAQAQSHVYLLSGGKLGEWGAGAGCDGPISKIARDIRVRVNSQPVVTLVDFKAGFEDTARGVVTGMDWVTVIVDPTQASLALANHMKQMVEAIHAGHLPATKHLGNVALVELANQLFHESPLQGASFVLSKISGEKTESFLRRRLADRGITPIGVIRQNPRIGKAWLTGGVIDDARSRRDAKSVVLELEKAVTDATASV